MAMIPRHLIQKARRRAIEIEAATVAAPVEAPVEAPPKVVEVPVEAPKPPPVVEAPAVVVKVEAPAVEADEEPADEDSPFAGVEAPASGTSVTWDPSMKREELLAVAKALGVTIPTSARSSKTKIIAALEAAAASR